MCLWDAACIVIVVHACDFKAAEVLECPRASYFAQRRQVDVIAWVRREHEVLKRRTGLHRQGGVSVPKTARVMPLSSSQA